MLALPQWVMAEPGPIPTAAASPVAAPRRPAPWTSLGLSGGGGMFTPAISPADPKLLLVNCDMSGVYRSKNAGESWQWINRSQPLLWPKDFDVDPRDSQTVYLGASDASNAEGGLYKTTDGGASWTRVARKGSECFGATVHPRKPGWVYLCITESAPDAGLWLSKDAGQTWTALEGLPFRNAQRVTFDPKDDSIVYVSTFGGSVWRGPAEP